MATTEEWVAAVAKIRGYVKTYLGLKSLNAKQQAALQTDLATLDKDLAALSASLQAAQPLSADQIWARFLDAEDAVLIAQGKPAGRDGAERGSVTRDEAIAIVNGLGIPGALETLAAAGYGFGPEPPAGTIA